MTNMTDPAAPLYHKLYDCQHSGLTALEHVCLTLRVLHPDLPGWMYDLIVEARRLDAVQAFACADDMPNPQMNAEWYINKVLRPIPETRKSAGLGHLS